MKSEYIQYVLLFGLLAWKRHMAYALVSWETVKHVLHYVGLACEDRLAILVTLGLAQNAYLICVQCFISHTLFLKVLPGCEQKCMIDFNRSGLNLHSHFIFLSWALHRLWQIFQGYRIKMSISIYNVYIFAIRGVQDWNEKHNTASFWYKTVHDGGWHPNILIWFCTVSFFQLNPVVVWSKDWMVP